MDLPAEARTPLVFVVDDEPSARKLMTTWMERDGYEVRSFESGEACLGALGEGPCAVCLDIVMPGIDGMEVLRRIQNLEPELPVIMVTAEESLDTAVESMKLGAYDYIRKPIDRNRLRSSLKKAVEKYDMATRISRLYQELGQTYSFHNIVGRSAVMKTLFTQIERLLNNTVNVFIEGESGTGKELVARAIHYQGARRFGPFEAVNCGAIPETLQESEFFGHEKGAFTGAIRSQPGKIEVANGGTLFLDEVGEMSPALQVKLLRFLEERSFERVGGRKRITVDVRVISATNKILKKEVEAGKFREDLYYRLMVFPISLPPLRDRKEDIPLLIRHFLLKYKGEAEKDINNVERDVMEALLAYNWPGNVRELENVIQRAMVTSENNRLRIASLPPELMEQVKGTLEESRPRGRGLSFCGSGQESVDIVPMAVVEKNAICHALKATRGNVVMAAKGLGISRATFYRKLEKYHLRETATVLLPELGT